MYPLIRDIHAYLGVALAALLAIYTWTGFEIVHGGGKRPREIARSEPSVTPVGGANDAIARVEAAARAAAEQAGLAGGAVVRARFEKGAWRARVERVSQYAEVTLTPGSSSAEVRLWRYPARGGVTQLHHVSLTDARGARFAWAIAIDVLSVALIAFALTGVLLFLALKRERRLGWALLAASTLYTLGSIAHLVTGAP
ncbi:MAG: hypothetical protein FJ091_01190 [Deltaproteobacteria bacterium]|nr:hypothetical protein [Deltaproteobacteria bacterium]